MRSIQCTHARRREAVRSRRWRRLRQGQMDKAHYRDAILNRKALVRLLVHETSGGMSAFAARPGSGEGIEVGSSGHCPEAHVALSK